MPREVKNAEGFEHVLDSLANGFGRVEKLNANEAGANVFIKIMKPKIPERNNVHEEIHLKDALIKETRPNGSVNVGFSSKSNKGYIGRFQNDGWNVRDRNGQNHSHVAGKHFWELTQSEAKGKVGQAVANKLKETMNKKVRGG